MSTHVAALETLRNRYGGLAASVLELVAWALVVYLVGRTVVVPLVRRALARSDLRPELQDATVTLTNAVVVLVALGVATGVAGFGSVLGGSALVVAALSLAVGFAAQDVLSNFVAGLFIIQNPRLNVGDTVAFGDHAGTVRDIGFRTSRVRTADNDTVIVPNTDLATTPVVNRSVNDPLWFSAAFGVGYADDVDAATEVVRDAVADHPDVLSNPAPTVRVTELADAAVVLTARAAVANEDGDDRAVVKAEVNRAVLAACEAAGVDLSTTTQHAVTGDLAVRHPVPAPEDGG
jgi:small conductance mechanosensitive channel